MLKTHRVPGSDRLAAAICQTVLRRQFYGFTAALKFSSRTSDADRLLRPRRRHYDPFTQRPNEPKARRIFSTCPRNVLVQPYVTIGADALCLSWDYRQDVISDGNRVRFDYMGGMVITVVSAWPCAPTSTLPHSRR